MCRSCDVGGGSHDQEKWACPEPQQGSGEGGEVEECLSRAVGRWCDWGGGEEDREGGEVARVLYFLRLTAELCHLTCQVCVCVIPCFLCICSIKYSLVPRPSPLVHGSGEGLGTRQREDIILFY